MAGRAITRGVQNVYHPDRYGWRHQSPGLRAPVIKSLLLCQLS